MKFYVSRRNFLKAAGVSTAAAVSMAAFGGQTAMAAEASEAKKGGLTILYTNDAHTYIDNEAPELSYASVAAIKQRIAASGQDVLLVDAGDHVQGTAYGSMDEGATIIQLMNAAGYDVATLGNHEFDYGMTRAKEIIKEADYPYISCNFNDLRTGMRVLPAIKTFTIGGKKYAFVGITTPESITKSTPAYFMDASQSKYIYSIDGGDDGQALYKAVQKAVDKARTFYNADYVIALGHLGVDESSSPWTSREVIANTTGIDVFIDGHSHTTMELEWDKNAEGVDVALTQTGCYFGNVGKLTIDADGVISAELISTNDNQDATIAVMQESWIEAVDDMLGDRIADSVVDFYINDPEAGNRLIRSQETNLGDFVADGIYTYFNEIEQLDCDLAIMNGGGIRADVPAGEWTFKTCKTVSPFGNVACLMEVTGQQIQDALEFGARYAGSGQENGGFLQVAGASYEIHTDVPNTVQTDDVSVWIGSATGTPRVQNIKIYNKATGTYEPIDLAATYTLGGMNYTLRSLGDGFAMFDGATLVKDYVSEDYLVMASYAMTFAGETISSANSLLADYPGYLLDYENPYGAGRIVLV